MNLKNHESPIATPAKLYGLVLAGGRSSRMGEDKALISYRGRPHAQYCYDLLSQYCEKTFISIRPDTNYSWLNHQIIFDIIEDAGPVSGIIAAMAQHPNVAWLVLACDFPHIDHDTIKTLVQNRRPDKMATAYFSPEQQFPEPLCTIYEPWMMPRIESAMLQGSVSPRRLLMESEIEILKLSNSIALQNANSPAEKKIAMGNLNSE